MASSHKLAAWEAASLLSVNYSGISCTKSLQYTLRSDFPLPALRPPQVIPPLQPHGPNFDAPLQCLGWMARAQEGSDS